MLVVKLVSFTPLGFSVIYMHGLCQLSHLSHIFYCFYPYGICMRFIRKKVRKEVIFAEKVRHNLHVRQC